MPRQITKHAKYRLKERINVTNNYASFIRTVMRKGKSKYEYDGPFFNYLMTKYSKKRCNIKIYRENICVISKNSKRLITVYPVPDKYLPTSKYEVSKKSMSIIGNLKKLEDIEVLITLDDDSTYQGTILCNKYQSLASIKLLLPTGKIIKISGDDIKDYETVSNITEDKILLKYW